MSAVTVVLVFCIFQRVSASFMIDLNGIWTVTNENRGYNITGHVPGSMFTVLLDNKLILDPYYRKNDDLYRWITRDDWTYTRTFNISSEMIAKRVALTCEGLDTIATVYVNGKLVGTSDNMFVRYTFDIQHAIKPGVNDIKVAFKSAVVYAEERYSNHPYLIPPKCVPPQYKGECHVQMIRKEQCSFSWDWGPSFPTQGIWRSIYIHGYDSAVISYVTAETHKGADLQWNLVISVFMDVASSTSVDGQLEVRLDNTTVSARKQVTISQNSSAVNFNITVPNTVSVKLWWPNGYGNQSLYSLSVSFTSATGKEISNKRINIGFRTVELIQDYVSQNTSYGCHFYFKINGLPIFLKGSNWIPADSFLERVTRDKILNLLLSAKDVHMNVLRVWGGGFNVPLKNISLVWRHHRVPVKDDKFCRLQLGFGWLQIET